MYLKSTWITGCLILFSFIFPLRAPAGTVYFVTNDNWAIFKFDTIKRSCTSVGVPKYVGTDLALHNAYFYDVAFDPHGSGFGTDGGKLHQYDPSTSRATNPVTYHDAVTGDPIPITSITFTPDGKLWGVGFTPGSGTTGWLAGGHAPGYFYQIDPTNGSILSKVLLQNPTCNPAEIAYDPKQMNDPLSGQFYLTCWDGSAVGHDSIYHLNPTNGVLTIPGTSGPIINWGGGMDFVDVPHQIQSVRLDQPDFLVNIVTNGWSTQTEDTTASCQFPGNVFGAGAFHSCDQLEDLGQLNLNGSKTDNQLIRFESAMVFDGSSSQNVLEFQWTIIGPDASGAMHKVTLPWSFYHSGNSAQLQLDLLRMSDPSDSLYNPALDVFQFRERSLNASFIQSYSVTLTLKEDSYCSNLFQHTVSFEYVRPGQYLTIPNAFSPNGDGLNDIFRALVVNGFQVSLFQIEIQNRWGQTVFFGNDINQGWDGKFQGVDQPIGTYFYFITYQVNTEPSLSYSKGDLTLIR